MSATEARALVSALRREYGDRAWHLEGACSAMALAGALPGNVLRSQRRPHTLAAFLRKYCGEHVACVGRVGPRMMWRLTSGQDGQAAALVATIRAEYGDTPFSLARALWLCKDVLPAEVTCSKLREQALARYLKAHCGAVPVPRDGTARLARYRLT